MAKTDSIVRLKEGSIEETLDNGSNPNYKEDRLQSINNKINKLK